MASNTEILIKRSFATATPANLAAGELAYSYTSNNLFIGTADGTNALQIGGFKNFPITAGQYGSTTAIPVLRISANGLVTNVTTSAIASTLNISGDTGTDGINLLTETLAFAGGDGLTSAVTANTVTFNVDNTVFRANTPIVTQYIDSSVQIAGNLTVLGTETVINVDTIKVDDPLIQLAANNTSDVVDIGFIGHYYDGVQRHTGFYRHAGDKQYYLFNNYTAEPTANVIPPFSSSFVLATLRANLTANTSNVLNVLTLQNGSQLYANGNAYFANAPYLDAGAILDDNLVVNSAKRLRLNNNDNSATVDIYNDGGANTNLLYVNSDIEISRNLYVANRIYGNLSNNTLYLVPSANYAPEVNDQYIIVDPTAPNHIHLRAGGAIDSSNAELFLGGENTNVQVSDTAKETYIAANSHYWSFSNDAKLILPNGGEIYDVLGNIYIASPTTTFSGNITSNGTTTINGNVFVPNLPNVRTGNLVYFDTANGRFSYADDNALTPTSIANGAFSLSIQSTNGLLVHNGSGIQLANGAIIKDTSGNAVAFGENAGTLTQGTQAVAIGDSAGYNNQGAYGVAVGYGAGNVNQGQTAVAIGINAGISNQGAYGVAIGNSSGAGQGQYGIALGYDSGNQQGQDSIAIGTQAGKGNTSAIGVNTIAIGNKAAFESAAANSIIINASGTNLSAPTSGFYVNPIRTDATSNNILYYNDATKEVTYGTLSDIRVDVLSNGIYSWAISGVDGGLRSNTSSQIIGGTEGGIKIDYWSGANTGMQIQNEISGNDLFISAFDAGRALLRWHSTSVDPEVANSRVNFVAQSDGAYIKNIFWDSTSSSYLTHNWRFKPNGTLSLPHGSIISDANNSIDIGFGTKTGTLGTNRVSIGTSAGTNAQGNNAIAIGRSAGTTNQGTRAIALGHFAASNGQGQDAIAIGSFAGEYGAVQGSIILNASGSAVNGNNSGFFVSPMSYTASQDATYDGIVFYNSNTKEVRYSYALDGGSF